MLSFAAIFNYFCTLTREDANNENRMCEWNSEWNNSYENNIPNIKLNQTQGS